MVIISSYCLFYSVALLLTDYLHRLLNYFFYDYIRCVVIVIQFKIIIGTSLSRANIIKITLNVPKISPSSVTSIPICIGINVR